MKKNLFHIDHYMRCGAMPIYLIFLKHNRKHYGNFVMLCTAGKLRQLLRARHGFSNPSDYGKILFKTHEKEPNEILRAVLKVRYFFDLDSLSKRETTLP